MSNRSWTGVNTNSTSNSNNTTTTTTTNHSNDNHSIELCDRCTRKASEAQHTWVPQRAAWGGAVVEVAHFIWRLLQIIYVCICVYIYI